MYRRSECRYETMQGKTDLGYIATVKKAMERSVRASERGLGQMERRLPIFGAAMSGAFNQKAVTQSRVKWRFKTPSKRPPIRKPV
jgi:hypothetical protein